MLNTRSLSRCVRGAAAWTAARLDVRTDTLLSFPPTVATWFLYDRVVYPLAGERLRRDVLGRRITLGSHVLRDAAIRYLGRLLPHQPHLGHRLVNLLATLLHVAGCIHSRSISLRKATVCLLLVHALNRARKLHRQLHPHLHLRAREAAGALARRLGIVDTEGVACALDAGVAALAIGGRLLPPALRPRVCNHMARWGLFQFHSLGMLTRMPHSPPAQIMMCTGLWTWLCLALREQASWYTLPCMALTVALYPVRLAYYRWPQSNLVRRTHHTTHTLMTGDPPSHEHLARRAFYAGDVERLAVFLAECTTPSQRVDLVRELSASLCRSGTAAPTHQQERLFRVLLQACHKPPPSQGSAEEEKEEGGAEAEAEVLEVEVVVAQEGREDEMAAAQCADALLEECVRAGNVKWARAVLDEEDLPMYDSATLLREAALWLPHTDEGGSLLRLMLQRPTLYMYGTPAERDCVVVDALDSIARQATTLWSPFWSIWQLGDNGTGDGDNVSFAYQGVSMASEEWQGNMEPSFGSDDLAAARYLERRWESRQERHRRAVGRILQEHITPEKVVWARLFRLGHVANTIGAIYTEAHTLDPHILGLILQLRPSVPGRATQWWLNAVHNRLCEVDAAQEHEGQMPWEWWLRRDSDRTRSIPQEVRQTQERIAAVVEARLGPALGVLLENAPPQLQLEESFLEVDQLLRIAPTAEAFHRLFVGLPEKALVRSELLFTRPCRDWWANVTRNRPNTVAEYYGQRPDRVEELLRRWTRLVALFHDDAAAAASPDDDDDSDEWEEAVWTAADQGKSGGNDLGNDLGNDISTDLGARHLLESLPADVVVRHRAWRASWLALLARLLPLGPREITFEMLF